MPRRLIPVKERFWAKVAKAGPDECWLWAGSTRHGGYGSLRGEGSRTCISAHRYSYEQHKGQIPDGTVVCHSCDTPACVNPAHLWAGTELQNALDKERKGRGNHGWRWSFKAPKIQPREKPTMEERFWSKVDIRGPDDCWIWTANKSYKGYGLFRHEHSIKSAHRVSFLLAFGAIPDGLHVLHRCDVRACVNPRHLWAGTSLENIHDRVVKGRSGAPRGEGSHLSKLTDVDVREIRRLYGECTHSLQSIAALYEVSAVNISSIVEFKTWKHLTD